MNYYCNIGIKYIAKDPFKYMSKCTPPLHNLKFFLKAMNQLSKQLHATEVSCFGSRCVNCN